MKVTVNWLRELLTELPDTADLAHRLTMAGLEVEGIEQRGADIRSVVVGEIVEQGPHPAAERLTLCRVRSGDGATVPVVCGATNMKAGDRVALAPAGSVLPGNRRIEQTEIRGVTSAGMLCSEQELGLAEESTGLLVLPPDATLGERVGVVLGVEDTVLEIAVTPNRGDCLSVRGVAREIAVLTGSRLRPWRVRLRESGAPASESVAVKIEDPTGCRRYAARLARGVRIGPSPRWMQQRLLAVGLRPINNAVDVTNYVMMELGQPLHAFDYDRLPRPQIVVRAAGATSRIVTLDDAERRLVADDLLITSGDEAVAIAGVMGGASSEVGAETTTILLESAWFAPARVRRTARRLDLRSEASFRFERHVDPAGTVQAIDRAAQLLQQLAGAEIAPGVVDVTADLESPRAVGLRLGRLRDLLGVDVQPGEATTILKSLGAAVKREGSVLSVTPPAFRPDLVREIDLVEEVARVVGYERIPPTMPATPAEPADLPARLGHVRLIRSVLNPLGLTEAVTMSFAAPRENALFPGLGHAGRAVEVVNPLSHEQSQLRTSLLSGLLAVWRLNRAQGAPGLGAFTVGKVFWFDGECREGWRVGGVWAGLRPQRGLGRGAPAEFVEAKGTVESLLEALQPGLDFRWSALRELQSFHPGKTAEIAFDGATIGYLGALHPDVEAELDLTDPHWLFELDLDRLLALAPPVRRHGELPRFPAVVRDLALVAETAFPSDEVVRFVRSRALEWVEDIDIFDEYAGPPIPEGKKSLAYTIAYRAADRTLTDDEVNRVHGELTRALAEALPIQPR